MSLEEKLRTYRVELARTIKASVIDFDPLYTFFKSRCETHRSSLESADASNAVEIAKIQGRIEELKWLLKLKDHLDALSNEQNKGG